jgi:hypothetical protein
MGKNRVDLKHLNASSRAWTKKLAMASWTLAIALSIAEKNFSSPGISDVKTGFSASVSKSRIFGGRIPSPKFCKTLVKIYA